MNNFQSFYLNGVLTEVTQMGNYFNIQQFRRLHGMAYGWSPTTKKEWNMAWFRNVSKTKKEKAIAMFKLLQTSEI